MKIQYEEKEEVSTSYMTIYVSAKRTEQKRNVKKNDLMNCHKLTETFLENKIDFMISKKSLSANLDAKLLHKTFSC